MGKTKVLFEKKTEIWIDTDNNILCGNLCQHLSIIHGFHTFADCKLFNKNRYLIYEGDIILGYPRCEECLKLKQL